MLSRTQKFVARSAFRIASRLEASEKKLWLQLPPHVDEFQTHSFARSTEEALQDIYPSSLSSLIGTFPCRVIDGTSLREMIRTAFRTQLDDGCNPDDEALRGLRMLNIQEMLSKSSSMEITEKGEQCRVRVVVTAVYDEARSDESRGHMFFYRVLFENMGSDCIQLMGRHWKFYSPNPPNLVTAVEKFANGVIGLYPTLNSGEMFQYMSLCTLPEPHGEMQGSFQFSNKTTGAVFEAAVAPTRLLVPPSTRKKGMDTKR